MVMCLKERNLVFHLYIRYLGGGLSYKKQRPDFRADL